MWASDNGVDFTLASHGARLAAVWRYRYPGKSGPVFPISSRWMHLHPPSRAGSIVYSVSHPFTYYLTTEPSHARCAVLHAGEAGVTLVSGEKVLLSIYMYLVIFIQFFRPSHPAPGTLTKSWPQEKCGLLTPHSPNNRKVWGQALPYVCVYFSAFMYLNSSKLGTDESHCFEKSLKPISFSFLCDIYISRAAFCF